jgi:hypothetical protein
VKNTVLRPRSNSRLVADGQQHEAPDTPEKPQRQTQLKSAEHNHRSSNNNNKQTVSKKNNGELIDFSKQQQQQQQHNRPNDTAMIRIRDPVTSKVRTIFLNDSQIEELSKRHEQDKDKVYNAINTNKNSYTPPQSHQPRVTPSGIVEKPRRPLNIGKEPQYSQMDAFAEEDSEFSAAAAAANRSQMNNASGQHSTSNIMQNQEDSFDHLIERHQQEKNAVNDFKTQYANNNDISVN